MTNPSIRPALRGLRTAVVAAVMVATGALTSVTPVAAASPGDCTGSTTRAMTIVAHHDDDLLFMFPDVAKDIRAGACVLTLYLVASDYHDASEREDYVLAREKGLRAAYAKTAGFQLGDWVEQTATINGRTVPYFTLGDKLGILELRLPDNGSEYSSPLGDIAYGSLVHLYKDGLTVRDFYGQHTYNLSSLRKTIRAAITAFAPTVIRTMDPSAASHGGDESIEFHWDHVTTAKLVGDVVAAAGIGAPVVYYRDYINRYARQNLSDAAAADKLDIFRTFAAYDWDICPDGAGPDCVTEGFYYTLTRNQYRADQASMLPFVPATPTQPNRLAQAVFAGRTLLHPASGRCVVVQGGAVSDDLKDGEALTLGTCEPPTDDAAKLRLRRFTFVGGYLKADRTNVCIVPATAQPVAGTPVVVRQCSSTSPRWTYSRSTDTFRHVGSGLVISPARTPAKRGTPLVLKYPSSTGGQRLVEGPKP